MIFETERLIVRQPDWKDADDFYELNSDPDIVRFIRPPRTREEANEKLRDRIENNNAGGNGLGGWVAATKQEKCLVGFFGLFQLPGSDEVHLGYSLLKPYWGLGYATEMTLAGISYAFFQLRLQVIVSTTFPDHFVSQKILLKCGFSKLCEMDDEGQPLYKYQLKNSNCPPSFRQSDILIK
ncbi:MAG: GNAT family N-acetyltransferase [Chitinophagaceae bacterium]